jgi:hypothetical protein
MVIAVVMLAGRGRSPHAPRTLQVEMQASGTVARLFWSADSQFADDRSIRVPLRPTSGGFQTLRFPLPSQGARRLRFDPTDAPGEILIGKVQLVDSNGQVLGALNPESLKPASQIASISRLGDVTRVVTEPSAANPSLVASLACVEDTGPLDSLSRVTPVSLALVSLAVAALLLASLVVVGRAVFRDAALPPAGARTGRLAALWIVALFLVVFSAKLFLMRQNPVTVPFWDQWDAEARTLFVPFNDCDLSWPQMFSLHNEHRIFFTRLLALDLLVVNGQWDPRLEQVVNAAMHALTAVLVAVMFWVVSGRRWLDLLVFVSAVIFAVPFSWDNTLAGFQSAFYFLLLFSVLALWLTTRYRAGSGPWWLGWLCAVAAIFTSAGGVLTTVAIIGVVALKVGGNWREWREPLITLASAAAVLAIGIAMSSLSGPGTADLKPGTVAQFSGALAHNLAWPWIDRPSLALVMWLPVGLLLVSLLPRLSRTTELERLTVALGIWVALNAAAVAYGRGAALLPERRYLDFLSLGVVANAAALMAWLDRAASGSTARRVARGALAGWLVFAVVGVDRLAGQSLRDLAVWRPYFAAHAANVKRFVVTGDLAEFTSKRSIIDIPYPSGLLLATILRDPYIRGILPGAAREPVHLEPRVVTNNTFVRDGSPERRHDPLARTWGSYSERGRSAEGRFDSQPVSCRRDLRLSVPVSGYLGWPNQYLALKDLTSGADLAIMPATVPREAWVDVSVRCPDGPFAITAIDAAGDSWFAFREPVEVGSASVVAERLISWSREVLLAALALAVLAARWTW